MTGRTNELGQPIGDPIAGWTPRQRPPRTPMVGRWCRLEPLDAARHAAQLYAANATDGEGRMWTYLSTEPFASEEAYRAWADRAATSEDPLFHAILDDEGRAVGVATSDQQAAHHPFYIRLDRNRPQRPDRRHIF